MRRAASGRLRIIAGELKGRRIAIPPGVPIRPTADRVREALFSILGGSVVDAEVLDLYSGSGALGFEALSRGAAGVSFVEADRRAVDALRATAARLGVERRCMFFHAHALRYLSEGGSPGPFRLALADPPYDSLDHGPLLPLAAARLATGGLLVVERDAAHEPPQAAGSGLERTRTARYGRCCLDFYHRPPPAPSS
jgi:16S rRNA (guanine966-N2)-methyltransferase